MADHSKIEWTDATWNPVRGCALVSPGCTNCYAMRQAHRHSNRGGAYESLTKMTKAVPVWTGGVKLVPELIGTPLKWKQPRRIFVNSMSDLFHEDVPLTFIARVFNIMGNATQHTFQVLTKRAERMRDAVRWYHDITASQPYPNVWLAVSVEDQARADERIPLLLQTPAAVRCISAEPLLGPLNLASYFWHGVHQGEARYRTTPSHVQWLVVGGESGPGARSFDIAWARSLLEQCRAAGVPYFLKQLGAYVVGDANDPRNPGLEGDTPMVGDGRGGAIAHFRLKNRKGGDPSEWPADLRVREYPR